MKEEEIRKREVLNRYLRLLSEDIECFFRDKSSFDLINCPACGSKNWKSEFEKEGFQYVSCTECATLFVNPRPPWEKFVEFYADSPSTHFWVNDFFKPVAEVRRVKIFRPRAEYVHNRFCTERIETIGDIGAGFGLFLEELRALWPEKNMMGIEPSLEMASICRGKGFQVIEKPVEYARGLSGSFDLVTAFELFEHVFDPSQFLLKVHEILKPGGFLVLTTLNGQGFDIQLLWERSKSVQPPHHLNFFNPQSLKKILERTGYEFLECETPGRLDWDIVEGMILHEGVKLGTFWDSFAHKGTLEAKQDLQNWIVRYRMSSHLRIIARRPIR